MYSFNNPLTYLDGSGEYPSRNDINRKLYEWLYNNEIKRGTWYIPRFRNTRTNVIQTPRITFDNRVVYQTYGIDGNVLIYLSAYDFILGMGGGIVNLNINDTCYNASIICLPVTNWINRIKREFSSNVIRAAKASLNRIMGNDYVDACITFLTTGELINCLDQSGMVLTVATATTGAIDIFCRFVPDTIFMKKELKKVLEHMKSENLMSRRRYDRDRTYVMLMSSISLYRYNWRTSYSPTWSRTSVYGPFAVTM